MLNVLYRENIGFLLIEFYTFSALMFCGQILEKSDYTLISGNPYIKKSGKSHVSNACLPWVELVHDSEMNDWGIFSLQAGERFHFTSICPMKLKTRPLNLTRTETFSVLSLLFVRTCSTLLDFLLGLSRYEKLISMNLIPTTECKYWFLFSLLFLPFGLFSLARGGRFSDGWGSCERREKRFMKPNHDIPSTAETRAKNRACQVCTSLRDAEFLTFSIINLILQNFGWVVILIYGVK